MRQNESGVCLRRRYRQILLGGSVRTADNLSNELTGSCYLVGARRMRSTRPICQLVDLAPVAFLRIAATTSNMQGSGFSPCKPAPADEQQRGGQNHGCGNIPEARINRRRQRGGKIGVQYAIDTKAEQCDNTSRG